MTKQSKEIETITTPEAVLDEPRPAGAAAYAAPAAKQPGGTKKPWAAALAGVLILGILGGFVVGLQVGKSSGASAVASTSQMGGPGGMQGGMGRMGAFGTVTAVSDSSITIQDERQGGSSTYAITSSTTVTDNGSTASVGNIQKGDTVMVQTASAGTGSSTGSTNQTASSIVLNPSMQGGPGGAQSQNSQTSTDSSSSSSI